MKYLFIALLLLWLIPIAFSPSELPEVVRTMQQVETGLRSAAELNGRSACIYYVYFFLEDDGAAFTFDVTADGTLKTWLAFGQDPWTRISEQTQCG